jgi:hypothetical protein
VYRFAIVIALTGCQEAGDPPNGGDTSAREESAEPHFLEQETELHLQWLVERRGDLGGMGLDAASWQRLVWTHQGAQCEPMGLVRGHTEEADGAEGLFEGAWYFSMLDNLKQVEFRAFGDYELHRTVGSIDGMAMGVGGPVEYSLHAPLLRQGKGAQFSGNWMEETEGGALEGELYGVFLPDRGVIGVWTVCVD